MGIVDAAVSAQNVRRQMAFQKEMYSSRWQRTVTDMRAAGINPMLAYQTGVSGTSPAGAGGGQGGVGAGDILGGAVQTGKQISTAYSNYKAAKAGADSAQSKAAVDNNARIISDRDTKIGISPAGVAGAQARQIPSSAVQATGYGFNRLKNMIDKTKKPKWNKPTWTPKGKTKSSPKKFRQFKFKKGYRRNRGGSGRY